jgi:anti-sigma B factor antagonist
MPLACGPARPQAPGRAGVPGLHVDIRPGDPPVAEVRGEIDVYSAPWLRDELLRVIRRHGPRLLLDFSGVTFLDCVGISVLLATCRRAQLEDGWIRVVRPSDRARRIICLLGPTDELTPRTPWQTRLHSSCIHALGGV